MVYCIEIWRISIMRSNLLKKFLCVYLSPLIPVFFLCCIQTLYEKLSCVFNSCRIISASNFISMFFLFQYFVNPVELGLHMRQS
jgi:hypothetical protein